MPKGFKSKAERRAEAEEEEELRWQLEEERQTKRAAKEAYRSKVIATYQISDVVLSS